MYITQTGTYYTTHGLTAHVEEINGGIAKGYVEGWFSDTDTWWETDTGINPGSYKYDLGIYCG